MARESGRRAVSLTVVQLLILSTIAGAFITTMGRSIIGKFIPVVITVSIFVAAGFLHSPANMGYLSLAQPLDVGPGWGTGLFWAVLPTAIGNIIGAFFFVALPFHLLSRPSGQRSNGNPLQAPS